MSTRAMVGYTDSDGTWTAVWNHLDGNTKELGRWMIRQVKSARGDLGVLREKYIDGCSEGWSSLRKGEKAEEPVGFFKGEFDGIVAKIDPKANPLALDCNFLYLLYPPKRRLYVFEVKDGPMRPFGIITFDEEGKAKPRGFPSPPEN